MLISPLQPYNQIGWGRDPQPIRLLIEGIWAKISNRVFLAFIFGCFTLLRWLKSGKNRISCTLLQLVSLESTPSVVDDIAFEKTEDQHITTTNIDASQQVEFFNSLIFYLRNSYSLQILQRCPCLPILDQTISRQNQKIPY